MWIWSLGGEDSLKKEVATHSSILAWKIPWTEEPGGLQSMWSQRVWHDWVTEHTHTYIIALQCCVSFCWTITWISCIYTYIPSLLSLLPTALCHQQSTKLSSRCYAAGFTSYFTQASAYMSMLFSMHPLSFLTAHNHS